MKRGLFIFLFLLFAVALHAEDGNGDVKKGNTDILKKEIQDIDFKAVPLEEAISFLNSERGTNIKYSLVSEYKQKFPKSPEITIHKEKASLGKLLKDILSQSPGFTMLNKRNNIVILPRDWKEKDAFLTMKVSMVKKDVIISDIIDSISKKYFIKHPPSQIPPEKETHVVFVTGGSEKHKEKQINIIISDTRVIDILLFFSEIDERFKWRIDNLRGFCYGIRIRSNKSKDKKSK